jgi:hypothetical protein
VTTLPHDPHEDTTPDPAAGLDGPEPYPGDHSVLDLPDGVVVVGEVVDKLLGEIIRRHQQEEGAKS